MEPDRKPKVIYIDNSLEFGKACEDLYWNHCTSTPHRSETNGIAERAVRRVKEWTSHKPPVIYTGNSLEFVKSCEDLSWNHRTSTPHRTETKGIAERAVRRVKEGTSGVLLQSGLDEKWCADSMECCCYLRNIQDILGDGKTS